MKTPSWFTKLATHSVTFNGVQAGVALGKAEVLFAQIPDQTVDLILTDPPYFIDGMGNDWDQAKLDTSKNKAKVIGSMPVGMKFDPSQGVNLQAFLTPIFEHCFRVLKPGGFIITFSQARLYHRMGIAVEDAGFEIRDMLGWTYEGQAKAFSQDHFVRKMNLSTADRQKLLASLGGRKTPQLKPMIEPMVLGQKPKDGTFVHNWVQHSIGLIDASEQWDGKFPGNLMKCAKPSRQEKGPGNAHLTVKPQKVLQHLIKVFTPPGAFVLDPFAGSSSTQCAALATGRSSLGFEVNPNWVKVGSARLLAMCKSSSVTSSAINDPATDEEE